MRRVSLSILIGVIALATPAQSAESVLAQYRGITLGDSLQTVVALLQLTAGDVKVVHDQPALVQQATWRPRLPVSGLLEDSDSVAEMGLTFHAGQLARITVDYARVRTQGLTDADLREALERRYGQSLLVSVPTQPIASAASPGKSIARWEDAETLVILWREQFPNRIGLIIASTDRVAAIERAAVDAARLETEAGPARELARRAAEAAAIRERDEKIRLENKTKFKP